MKPGRILIILSVLLAFPAHAQVFDVAYGDEPVTRTLLIPAESAKALVLLFPGGGGVLKLSDQGTTANMHTFVRSRNLWARHGIDAVLVDTPYDLGNERLDRRPRPDHQERIRTVVNFYKDKTGLPIWLFGHSRGTVSVTRFASQGRDWTPLIAGIIVAGTVQSASLDTSVTLPVLAIHHKHDSCRVTPASASESIVRNRPPGARAEFVLIDGGQSSGDACMSFAHHGFNQNEDELVDTAARFILATP
ncbi:alpha/beta hydrolase [Propionivibrio dicarboxylicus]|uniref:Alpha/beta hydrolase family protein n=1 Tax=Propionivibrio dicarboxylicus TaxID=83767 RepID=A0A1G8GUR5_9RHOO|nr:hypothetical protein [Propionivibrio dicarboxylicus]SDH98079.1 hypothetical protein SAMN05660652_02642 [Propionivibrio dicarboxylicus]